MHCTLAFMGYSLKRLVEHRLIYLIETWFEHLFGYLRQVLSKNYFSEIEQFNLAWFWCVTFNKILCKQHVSNFEWVYAFTHPPPTPLRICKLINLLWKTVDIVPNHFQDTDIKPWMHCLNIANIRKQYWQPFVFRWLGSYSARLVYLNEWRSIINNSHWNII